MNLRRRGSFFWKIWRAGIAWKDPEQAVRQKERLRAMKEKKELEIGHAQQADSMEEEVPEDAQGMNMTM